MGYLQGRGQLQHMQDPGAARDQGEHLGILRGRASREAPRPASGEDTSGATPHSLRGLSQEIR